MKFMYLFLSLCGAASWVKLQAHTSTQAVMSVEAPAPIGPYSQAILTNASTFLFISGQIPLDPVTGELVSNVSDATHQIMSNLRAILEEAGMSFENVVKTTIFLTNMKDFAVVNAVYSTYFTNEDLFPARETVQVATLPKGACLEISMIAAQK